MLPPLAQLQEYHSYLYKISGNMPTPQQIEQFRIKARQKGFSEVQIANEIARKTQEETKTNIQTPQATQQKQPMSVGGLIKNAGQDVLDFAVNTPIQAVKNTIGAGFEIARSFDINSQIKASRKRTEQLISLGSQIKAEKDPNKRDQLIKQARTLSGEAAQGSQKLEQTASRKNPTMDIENLPTIGEMGKGILKNIGNTLGITTDENGGLTFDINLALQSAYEHPVTTTLIAKDIVKGVTRKAGVKGVTKETKPGKIEAAGTELRRDVLNPQVEATPFYTEEMATLQKVQEKLGLEGSAKMQLEQLPSAFKKSQTEIKTLLKDAESPQKGTLSQKLLKEMDEANYGLDDPQFSKAIETEMNILKDLEGKPATVLYEQMEKYRALLKSTRKKIDSGTTLLPKEEARLAAFNALKATIDTVSPEIRALNTLQNQMYEISEGLVKSTKKEGFGIGPVRVPTGVSQAVQDKAGAALQKAGEIKTKAGGLTSKVPQVPSGTGAAMGISSVLRTGQQPTNQGQETQTEIPEGDYSGGEQGYDNEDLDQGENIIAPQEHPIFGTATKQQILLSAFKSGANKKQIDEIDEIYDRFSSESAEEKVELTDTAITKISDTRSAIRDVSRLKETINNANLTGPLTGLRALNPYDTDSRELQAEIDRVRQKVGKALEGGVLRKEDEEKYRKILPTMTDTKVVAMKKLQKLEKTLSQDLQDYVYIQTTYSKGRTGNTSQEISNL